MGDRLDFSKTLNKTPDKALAQMFGISSKEGSSKTELDIDLIVPFKNHPFRLYKGEKLQRMVESVKENGVIEAIIVRKNENGTYENLAGHNRVNASKIAGLTKVPADIRENISDAEAKLIVTETNFLRRDIDDMLPSELAKSLQMQLEACKELKRKQEYINAIESDSNVDGSKGEEQLTQLVSVNRSMQEVGSKNKMSRENVRRYIRLNYLNEGILNMVDEGSIKLVPAVNLSYLNMEEQNILFSILTKHDYRIDMKRSEKLKERSGKLTEDDILAIASGEFFEKKNKRKLTAVTVKMKLISRFFTQYATQTEITSTIETALEEYFERRRQQAEDSEKDNNEEVDRGEEN